jgi:phosphate transport system substrate-binding protein
MVRFLPVSWQKAGVLLLLLSLLLAACTGDATPAPAPTETPPPPILDVGLSNSATVLADRVILPYADFSNGVTVNFVAGNNQTLFEDLEAGHLDAILVNHIPPGDENWFNPVALDGLAIVVHPQNPLAAQGASLALSQAQAIFSGQVTNWADVGGAETLEIQPVGRERGSDARLLFDRRVLAEQRMSINSAIEPDNEALLEAVAADRGAVGYTMMSVVGEDVVVLPVEGIVPSPETTATQEYALTTPLYFVSPEEPTGELRGFLAWLQSEAGQALLGEKFGRVS